MAVHDMVSSAPEATFGFTACDCPTLGDIDLTEVTSHGWRVSDVRLPQGDPMRLLAFVERRDDAYEVLQVGDGLERHGFESMSLALAFVIETGPRLARIRLNGELSWMRRPRARLREQAQ